jgi:hypothetical protein
MVEAKNLEFERRILQLSVKSLSNRNYEPVLDRYYKFGSFFIGAPIKSDVLNVGSALIDLDVDHNITSQEEDDLSTKFKLELCDKPEFKKIYYSGRIGNAEEKVMKFAGEAAKDISKLKQQEIAIQELADLYCEGHITREDVFKASKPAALKTPVTPSVPDTIHMLREKGISVGTITAGILEPAAEFTSLQLELPAIRAEGSHFIYDKNSRVRAIESASGLFKRMARIRKIRNLGFSPEWVMYAADIKFMKDRLVAEVDSEDLSFMTDPHLGGGLDLRIGIKRGSREKIISAADKIAEQFLPRSWLEYVRATYPVYEFDQLPDRNAVAVACAQIAKDYTIVYNVVMAYVLGRLTLAFLDGSLLAGTIMRGMELKDTFNLYKNTEGGTFRYGLNKFLKLYYRVHTNSKFIYPDIASDVGDLVEKLEDVSNDPRETERQKSLMGDIYSRLDKYLWFMSHNKKDFENIPGFAENLAEYAEPP